MGGHWGGDTGFGGDLEECETWGTRGRLGCFFLVCIACRNISYVLVVFRVEKRTIPHGTIAL